MNQERLLERFLRYVQIDTTAVDDLDQYPSCRGQMELGKVLVEELQAMGITDATQDEHGVIYATVPATVEGNVSVVALNSHLDTSPETTGAGVKPQVIRDYQGGDIPLPGDPTRVITVDESPELKHLHGSTLVTTDGTTLLGGDDKGGVAVIMETAAWLVEHPEIAHGPVRILLTCDEEIGRGVDHVDLQRLGADVCYTLDGQGANEIDYETFSADLAIVTFRGINIHPSIAKDEMVNAIRATGDFINRLPKDELAPEVTCEREGFIHPYQIGGGVAEVTLKVLLRDFDTDALSEQAHVLRATACLVEEEYPGTTIDVEVKKQYRNMADGLEEEPRAVDFARQAHEQLGRQPRLTIVRGGTDGSQLTELGLPTPNLSTGQHRIHSPLEWACLDEMVSACEVLVELLQIWGAETECPNPNDQ